ncbi:MAG: cupin domain-containing protein [Gloeobacteraceae cyanobacterium ES-bin-316]|nr:cupin domain-containing protein [Ferruginibacter sp.]
MKFTYPHTIENCLGEKLIFLEVQKAPSGDMVLVENYVAPGCGPVMHTHWMQDESLTVLSGRLGYEIMGQPTKYAGAGETVLFKRGTAHRFWNDGEDILNCKGWIAPANTIVFFLSSIFNAQNKTGTARPEQFDAAYLMKRYAAEYDLPEIPLIVKKIIIPLTYLIGKLLGKYPHFENAPEPAYNAERRS